MENPEIYIFRALIPAEKTDLTEKYEMTERPCSTGRRVTASPTHSTDIATEYFEDSQWGMLLLNFHEGAHVLVPETPMKAEYTC